MMMIIKKEALGDITHFYFVIQPMWHCDDVVCLLGCSGNGRGVYSLLLCRKWCCGHAKRSFPFTNRCPPFWLRPAFTMRFTCAIQFTFFCLYLYSKKLGPVFFLSFCQLCLCRSIPLEPALYNPAPRLDDVFDSLFNLLSAYTYSAR